MFAIGFTLFVAILAATLWALRSILFDGVSEGAGTLGAVPHDPTTLELAAMAAITLATYAWMKRLQTIRERANGSANVTAAAPTRLEIDVTAPDAVPTRYAAALAEIRREDAIESAEQVA